MFCKNFKIVAFRQADENTAVLCRVSCGQWQCEECSKMLQRQWRSFLREKLPEVYSRWDLLTLTANGYTRSEQKSYASLKSGIDILMKRVRRVYGEIEYARVWERHTESEAIHAHFIIGGLSPYLQKRGIPNGRIIFRPTETRNNRKGFWSSQTWFKVAAYNCGMGYQVDLRGVSSEAATRYVTKYLTKGCQDIQIKGIRHIQTTRGIGSLPRQISDFQWMTGKYATQFDFNAGTRLIDLNTGEIIPPEYWKDFDQYPDTSLTNGLQSVYNVH